MSNLLSSLIARTTETAVTLQPRPHALFETMEPAALPSLPVEDSETAESASNPIQPPSPTEPRRPRPAPEMKPASAPPQPKPAANPQPVTERAPTSRPPVIPPLAASQPPSPMPVVTASEPTPARDRPPQIQPVVVETRLVAEQPIIRPQIQRIAPAETAVPNLEPTQKKRPETVPPNQPIRPVRLDSPPVPSLPQTEAPAARPTPATIKTTLITALTGPKTAPRPEAIVPTQAIPRLPSDQKRPLPDTTPPEPVIQVHIGRIEVRATQPETAPPSKKQRQIPVMDLDGYLRQRSARTEQSRSGRGGKP